MLAINCMKLICVMGMLSLFLFSCSTDGKKQKRLTQSILDVSKKKLAENVKDNDSSAQHLTRKKPEFYSVNDLPDDETAKFSRDDSDALPVILAGDSSPETLKAYLMQPFLSQVGTHDDVMNEAGVMAMPQAREMDAGMMMTTATMTKSVASNAADGAVVADATGGTASDEFSGTNVQVEGVDEGDIWKYDGERFYVLTKGQYNPYRIPVAVDGMVSQPVESMDSSEAVKPCERCGPERVNGKLRILTNTGKELSNTDLGDLNPEEIYLFEQRLAVVGNERSTQGEWGNFSNWQSGMIDINVMTITDYENPDVALRIKLQGYLIRSRRVNEHLYVVSRFSPHVSNIDYYPRGSDQIKANKKALDALNISEILPTIDVNDKKKPLIQPEQCWLTVMPKSQWGSPTLTLITKISLKTGDFQSTCIGGNVEGLYMSQKALYLHNTSYMNYENMARPGVVWHWREGNTHIHKFGIDDLSYAGSQLVDGLVGYNHASFRFGELSDGSLGVVTTKNEWKQPEHRLTVLNAKDNQWQVVAMLPNPENPKAIGKPGERIYSVRFMQDRAYIVTFEKTDPLYVIDLAKSEYPSIAGELEIPGFSDYLHPVGKDKLLGVGKSAAIGKNGVSYYQGVKVSLFDVGDISDPRELGFHIIGKRGSSTALASNHLAFTGIQQQNSYRFAFPISVHEGYSSYNYNRDSAAIYHDWKQAGLYLFEIKENVLHEPSAIITDEADKNQRFPGWQERRGLIQGEKVYHLKGDRIYASDWNNPSDYKGPF